MERGNPSRQRLQGARWRSALGALLAAAALAPLPALAQSKQAAATFHAEIREPLVVLKASDMDFARIMPGTANGTVVLNPATGTCTANAGIGLSGTCRAARFDGNLPFFYNLQVTRPVGNQVILTGPLGATMRLRNFTFAKGSGLMFGSDAGDPTYFVLGGTFIVYVGGTLEVARTQRPGIYNGTVTIRFNYD